jgi:hypothetical protein
MDDLFGLGEDKWWERLLTRWERVPGGVRTAFVGVLCGVFIVGLLVLLNSWGRTVG